MTDPSKSTPSGIDPRGPRFGAGVTALLLLAVIALGLATAAAPPSVAAGVSEPAFILFAVLVLLWAWGAFAGIGRHPFGLVFRKLVRPRLKPPAFLEDPTPPTFAQGVGFAIGLVGLLLHVVGVPYGLAGAASAAFVAAFLNSVFGYCLGCQLYLLLIRAGLLRASGDSA